MLIQPRFRRVSGAVAALVLVLSAGACSGDDGGDGEPDDPTKEARTEPEVALVVTTGKVVGKVPKKVRKRSVSAVGKVVDRWFEAAFVGGDHPRTSARGSWPGFTKDLTGRARKDKAFTTNARLADRIDGAEVVRRTVTVDLLGDGKRAAGATARFRLVFDTQGSVQRRVVVTGRLSLTPAKSRWRVFGYDVARSAGPIPAAAQKEE